MQTKILNAIIIASLIGIISLSAKDYFFPSKSADEIVISPTPTVIIEAKKTQKSEPPTPCTNRYFNFQKGTIWKYRLLSEFAADKSKNKIDKIFVNKIIDSTTSSVTVETSYLVEKKTKTTIVECKQTGIHGVPYPFLEEGLIASAEGQLALLNNVSFQPSLLLPHEEKLSPGGKWQTPIELKLKLPIPFLNFQISLNNEVKNESSQFLLGKKRNIIDIDSKLDLSSLPSDILQGTTEQKISSQFGENIGLIKSNFSLNLSQLAKINLSLQLLDFKEATMSSFIN